MQPHAMALTEELVRNNIINVDCPHVDQRYKERRDAVNHRVPLDKS